MWVNLKPLFILKAGTTYPTISKFHGDFDKWTAQALGDAGVDVRVLDVEHGASLPAAEACAGIVITGSHSMVTDDLSWRVRIEKWIPSLLAAKVPILGICFGHQLLARAAGGEVGFHPRGEEIGTTSIHLLPDAGHDVLFQGLPSTFRAQVSHSQTVLRLPPQAVCLAFNSYEAHHGFRIGGCAWGVQFHPEFNAGIMSAYIKEDERKLASAGVDVDRLLSTVDQTPIAAQTLANFGRFVKNRPDKKPIDAKGSEHAGSG